MVENSIFSEKNQHKKMIASDLDDIDEELPFELMEHAKAAVLDLLPIKSHEKYKRAYENFKDWQAGYVVGTILSDLLLAYFHVLDEKKYKSTSLWVVHSGQLKILISEATPKSRRMSH